MAYGYGSTYGREDDPSYAPENIGDPIKLDLLAGINEKRPKFRTRRQQEKAERYAQALEQDASSTAPLGHWTQALAQVGKGILGGLEEREIDQSDTARRDYLAAALEGDTSPDDLMKQGALYDVPELSDIGKYQAETDWRRQQAEQAEGWRQKSYDLQADELGWKKTKGPEGSTPKFTDITSIRKEIQDLPEAKAYSAAIPVYNSMVQAANNKAGDLNIVYGLAKMYDPTSVVRDGEQVLVRDTASLPDWLIGNIQALNGGARLLPETRGHILKEARNRADQYKSAFEAHLPQYRDLAKRYGIPEGDIIPQFQAYGDEDPETKY